MYLQVFPGKTNHSKYMLKEPRKCNQVPELRLGFRQMQPQAMMGVGGGLITPYCKIIVNCA